MNVFNKDVVFYAFLGILYLIVFIGTNQVVEQFISSRNADRLVVSKLEHHQEKTQILKKDLDLILKHVREDNSIMLEIIKYIREDKREMERILSSHESLKNFVEELRLKKLWGEKEAIEFCKRVAELNLGLRCPDSDVDQQLQE
jgi:hypothetical protein